MIFRAHFSGGIQFTFGARNEALATLYTHDFLKAYASCLGKSVEVELIEQLSPAATVQFSVVNNPDSWSN